MTLEKTSACKVNLLLNILGKRPDDFHELETVMHPVSLCDRLVFDRAGSGVELTCNLPELPVDGTNLVRRAAEAYVQAAGIKDGVRIQLEKRIPLSAGLGGGSSNAAMTLEGLNELFGQALGPADLQRLAASLGSDVPFFLQPCPALATGRGERIVSLEPFPALAGAWFLLAYPGFGVSTAWAYCQLARHPQALQGRPGRAQQLLTLLQTGDLAGARPGFYNALEAPVLEKYPLLALYQEFLREQGAPVTLMSGSGSTTFALLPNQDLAQRLAEAMRQRFGPLWTAVVAV